MNTMGADRQDYRLEFRRLLDDLCPASVIRHMDETKEFPAEVWTALAEGGWCGVAIPEEHGGSGGSLVDLCVIVEELGRKSVSLALMYFTTQFTGAHTFLHYGSDQQQAEFLPAIARGEVRFSFGFTEPEGGTDFLRSCATRAVADGDSYVISGNKVFTTGIQYSHYILVIARTAAANPDRPSIGFTNFIVPVGSPGVSYRPLDMFSVRASMTNELTLDDVRVPRSSVVGEVGMGFRQLFGSLNQERILTAAIAIGNAGAAVDAAVQYSTQRHAFGGPVGRFQALQHPLARIATDIEAARALTLMAAGLHDQGLDSKVPAAMAKFLASEAGFAAAHQGMRLMGGYGMSMEFPMQRHLRDSHALINGPITNEMCLNIIGESIGMPRSY
jgi:acyl-CoA dehydrogenase